MVKLLQAMAAFFNVFMYFVDLGQNQQLCGGSSPASLNRAGNRLFQHMEAYRCLIQKIPKSLDSDQLTMNASNLPPQKKNGNTEKKMIGSSGKGRD